MSKWKKILILSLVFIIIGVSALYFVLNMFFQIRVANERMKLVQNIHNEKMLIGLTYEECEKMLGPLKFEKGNAWVFPAGYTYTKVKGMADWEYYDLWVYYDNNKVVISTSIEKDQSG
jgi:hypothetical protein